MTRHSVFVYGTLKRGFPNHYALEDQAFLGTTRTKHPNFYLTGADIPFAFEVPNACYIQGELYKVDNLTLFLIDQLEGNGVLYTRKPVEVQGHGNAWMYLVPKPADFEPEYRGAVLTW